MNITTLGMEARGSRSIYTPDEPQRDIDRHINEHIRSAQVNLERFISTGEAWAIAAARGNYCIAVGNEADRTGKVTDRVVLEVTPLISSKRTGVHALEDLCGAAKEKAHELVQFMLENILEPGWPTLPFEAALFWSNVRDITSHAIREVHRHDELPQDWADALEPHWGKKQCVEHIEKLIPTRECLRKPVKPTPEMALIGLIRKANKEKIFLRHSEWRSIQKTWEGVSQAAQLFSEKSKDKNVWMEFASAPTQAAFLAARYLTVVGEKEKYIYGSKDYSDDKVCLFTLSGFTNYYTKTADQSDITIWI